VTSSTPAPGSPSVVDGAHEEPTHGRHGADRSRHGSTAPTPAPATDAASGGASSDLAAAADEADRALAEMAKAAQRAVAEAHDDGHSAVVQGYEEARRAAEQAYEQSSVRAGRP
jgi:hypothetical protein